LLATANTPATAATTAGFAVLTYIAPVVYAAAGLSGASISVVLAGFGAARASLHKARRRQVTARLADGLADGLALAVITGAPLAVDGPLMDRLAEPITGPDLPGPFHSRQQAPPGPPEHTRFEPRNLAFTDGLHRWHLDGTFLRQVTGAHDQDYSCTTEGVRRSTNSPSPIQEESGNQKTVRTQKIFTHLRLQALSGYPPEAGATMILSMLGA
jgi:hypothetical protein